MLCVCVCACVHLSTTHALLSKRRWTTITVIPSVNMYQFRYSLAAALLLCVGIAAREINVPGFLLGKEISKLQQWSLKITERVESIINCDTLSFPNSEVYNVIGSKPFQRRSEYASGRLSWWNDKYYLSFVLVETDKNAPYGTWIIGNLCGMSSLFVVFMLDFIYFRGQARFVKAFE